MGSQGSFDDCYFYYYSSCTKGKDCPFRHCEAALGTETVCSSWREGRCFRNNCRFRHMENRIKRAVIPCYWENQPGGCRKPHCVFQHMKSKMKINNIVENQGLILPESSTGATTVPTMNVNELKESVKFNPNTALSQEKKSSSIEDIIDDLASQPVEPFVVNFDEESDTESVSSTPMKCGSTESKPLNCSSARKSLSSSFAEHSEDNFGIKTLEQIRMEKIHKESEHFYKSDDTTGKGFGNQTLEVNRNSTLLCDSSISFPDYDAPTLSSPILNNQHIALYKKECYPPESEFICIADDEPIDIVKPVPKTDTSSSLDQERDLRGRLLKKRVFPSYAEKDPQKEIITSKKPKKKDGPLDFKIKTLEEIRKEKENKQVKNELQVVHAASEQDSSVSEEIKSSNGIKDTKFTGRPIIKRLSKASYSKLNSEKAVASNEISKNETCSQRILHEYPNSQEDANELTQSSTYEKSSSIFNGKRRNSGGEITNKSKIIKLESSAPELNTDTSLTIPEENSNGFEDVENMKTSDLNTLQASSTSPVSCLDTQKFSDVKDDSVAKSVVGNCTTDCTSNDIDLSKTETDTKTIAVAKDVDKTTSRSLSVDEFDNLFLNDTDVCLDEVEDTADRGAEDIFKEIEELFDS